MRVLLVRPAPPKYTIGLKNLMICEPLELEYVAAGLRGHQVEIIDMILDRNLPGKIRSFKPDVLGTSSYITGINRVKEICREAKSYNSNMLTVVGGVHATLVPEDFCDRNVDVIARGEGTALFRKIVDGYEQGKDLHGIPGLAFPAEGGLKYSPTGSLGVDIENLPLPRRDLVERYRHRYYYLFHQPVSIMKTTFGCPFQCNFCFCWRLTDGKVYRRSPDSIVEELEEIPTEEVYIVDDTFFLDTEHLKTLHQKISERNIAKNYLTYGHSDFIVRHPGIIRDWAEIGLKACIVGLETPIQEELHGYNKRTSIEANNEAIHILRENKVDVYGSFIVNPDWTHKEFRMLDDYIGIHGIFYTVIQPLTPLPGTEMYAEYDGSFSIERDQYELWDMQHCVLPTRLPVKQFYRQIRRIYLHKVARPWRARSLQLRTAPPIWSRSFLRLLSGAIRVLFALRKAHRHPRQLARRGTS